MGYLTTITIHNDALHSFAKNPEKFGQAILDGIEKADMENQEVTVPFEGYCNYITVQKPRHADDHAVYLHYGNCVTELYELSKKMPDLALKFIKVAKDLLKWAKENAEKEIEITKIVKMD